MNPIWHSCRAERMSHGCHVTFDPVRDRYSLPAEMITQEECLPSRFQCGYSPQEVLVSNVSLRRLVNDFVNLEVLPKVDVED